MIPDAPLVLAGAPTGVWGILWDILVLLTMALVMGNVAERLGQSVIVGYLLAGTLVGPNVFGWISTHTQLVNIAEIGVALLLFAIGLEFSPQRLVTLGKFVARTGPLQVVLTTALGFGGAVAIGLPAREALVVGMMVAMSSTACVLRLLTDRAEVDTRHGRAALGILLVQDAAVIPMILLVSVMAAGGSAVTVLWKLLVALVLAALLLAVFYVLFNVVAPRLLLLPAYRKNRDLPILLAVIMATGSAWATHAVGFGPALGAFVAGALLAASPFATQIRADTRPVATVMVTLFFAAIGMFGDPVWLVRHWPAVTGVVLGIVIAKPAIIALLAGVFGEPWRYGIATALCLAQVGEFSFVLAAIAQSDFAGVALMTPATFRTMVTATIVTLLLTPYLVGEAARVGVGLEDWLARARLAFGGKARSPRPAPAAAGHTAAGPHEGPGPTISSDEELILIIGFSSVGRRVAEGLLDEKREQLAVIDLDPDNVETAERYGLKAQLGDATQRDNLEHAGIYNARVVVISVRDHVTTLHLIHLIRDLSPDALIVARCHYHIHYFELLYTGAHEVVDEEDHLGGRLAAHVWKLVGEEGEPEA